MERALAAKVWTLLEPVVVAQGYEVVEVEVHGNKRAVLRVFLDGPSGITIDKCADFARLFSDLLDVEDPIKARYTLEVSSPGLNRPLRKPAHFKKAVGDEVTMKVELDDGRMQKLRGILVEAHEDRILVRPKHSAETTVPLANIVGCSVVYDFDKAGTKESKWKQP